MITADLISYIKKQQLNNKTKENIVSNLIKVGWHQSDIDEGFLSIENEQKPKAVLEEKKEIIKENLDIEIYNTELPVVERKIEKKKDIDAPKESVTPKIWTPMMAPIKENVVQNIVTPFEIPVKKEIVIENLIQPKIIEVKKEEQVDELMPTLIPKPRNDSVDQINKDSQNVVETKIAQTPSNKSFLNQNLPQSAMISSYRQDVLSANQKQDEVIKKSRRSFTKWYILILAVALIGFVSWVFMSGYINIKDFNLNFSLIKKDPKVLLLNNSKNLMALKSYKTETKIEISLPLFSDITTGLISGEAVNSRDKDSLLITTLGMINQVDGKILSDNIITIKSSLLQNDINTEVKNDGSDLYILVPDLSQLIEENTPETAVVKINEQQFDLVPSLFSGDLSTDLKKINIYKIISSGMPSFINSETLGVYDEFINSVEIVEKGMDKIKDVDTYHYSINPDRQLSKKLLSKIYENFTFNHSEEDKIKLEEILGATTISSFDVWVGKKDNNIYQYSVILDVPLSKIVGLGDRSIGDNVVTFDWKTTYYDFDIENEILIPETSIPILSFANSIKEAKLKNEVSSFKQMATNLFAIEKTYGSNSNSTGSCMSPNSGSLFSPLGHKKESTQAVSAISELLNSVMGTTFGAGYCYSDSKAWSLSIPITDDYDPSSPTVGQYRSYYCVDSTGETIDLINAPTTVVCK